MTVAAGLGPRRPIRGDGHLTPPFLPHGAATWRAWPTRDVVAPVTLAAVAIPR